MVTLTPWTAALLVGLLLPTAANAACADLLPAFSAVASAANAGEQPRRRPVLPSDIARLRDIGQPDGSLFNYPSPLAVSPDRRTIAFVIDRADPETNRHCRGLLLVNRVGPPTQRLVDAGGEYITDPVSIRGMVFPGGFPPVVTPSWSADGRYIFYLRRDQGRTQVWRARSDGGGARRISDDPGDVVAVHWDRDIDRVVYASRPATAIALAAIEREGRGGWLYDARFAPNVTSRPLPAEAPLEVFSIDPDGAGLRAADASAKARLGEGGWAPASATAPDGSRVQARRSGGGAATPLELVLTSPDGSETTCPFANCRGGITGVWFERGGDGLVYLRREGWAQGEMGLYRWVPGRAPEQIMHTSDVLQGCVQLEASLLCTRESATAPRYVSEIDLRDGSERKVFDPNPEFAQIALGKVERLRWTNDVGLEAWGDLVLPPAYRGGTRLPMVVVQYHSDGFLRGGTGDEYPIHALAAAGFAVLSVERPAFFGGSRATLKSDRELARVMQQDWAERRSLLSSLETGVRLAIERGIADPRRIGLTGLSDGASTVRFALINSTMFAAAAISSCCVESDTVTKYGGIGVARDFADIGYPAPGQDAGDFWKPYALSENADRIDTPLLMQLSDDEYLFSLQAFTALQAAGKPVEMYVFPGEHHIKWQPAHRCAIYRRNIDWFAYWLGNRFDPEPAKRAQYDRWNRLREGLKVPMPVAGAIRPESGAPDPACGS